VRTRAYKASTRAARESGNLASAQAPFAGAASPHAATSTRRWRPCEQPPSHAPSRSRPPHTAAIAAHALDIHARAGMRPARPCSQRPRSFFNNGTSRPAYNRQQLRLRMQRQSTKQRLPAPQRALTGTCTRDATTGSRAAHARGTPPPSLRRACLDSGCAPAISITIYAVADSRARRRVGFRPAPAPHHPAPAALVRALRLAARAISGCAARQYCCRPLLSYSSHKRKKKRGGGSGWGCVRLKSQEKQISGRVEKVIRPAKKKKIEK
jgi:hypothetical protein